MLFRWPISWISNNDQTYRKTRFCHWSFSIHPVGAFQAGLLFARLYGELAGCLYLHSGRQPSEDASRWSHGRDPLGWSRQALYRQGGGARENRWEESGKSRFDGGERWVLWETRCFRSRKISWEHVRTNGWGQENPRIFCTFEELKPQLEGPLRFCGESSPCRSQQWFFCQGQFTGSYWYALPMMAIQGQEQDHLPGGSWKRKKAETVLPRSPRGWACLCSFHLLLDLFCWCFYVFFWFVHGFPRVFTDMFPTSHYHKTKGEKLKVFVLDGQKQARLVRVWRSGLEVDRRVFHHWGLQFFVHSIIHSRLFFHVVPFAQSRGCFRCYIPFFDPVLIRDIQDELGDPKAWELVRSYSSCWSC